MIRVPAISAARSPSVGYAASSTGQRDSRAVPFGQPLTETPRRLRIPDTKDVPSDRQHWSTDFIVGLPMAQTRHGDATADRLSKLASYEPVPGVPPIYRHIKETHAAHHLGQPGTLAVSIVFGAKPQRSGPRRRRGRRRKDGGNPRSPHGRRAVPPHGRKCSPKRFTPAIRDPRSARRRC